MQTSFKNSDDLYRYLNNTICMYKGDPVYIKATDSLTKVVYYEIGKPFKIQTYLDIADDAFQAFPFELGLMNTEYGCVFISRSAIRNSNYGILTGTLNFQPLVEGDVYQGITTTLQSKDFLHCLTNTYPSLKQAIETAKETSVSVAFNKYYYIGCVEEGDTEVLGMFYSNSSLPFAVLDKETNKFKIFSSTRRNRIYYSIAVKSGIIPTEMRDA